MKNVIVSGFYFDFLVPPIEKLENRGHICITRWIVGDDSQAVKHNKRVWWRDIVFDSDYEASAVLSDAESEYLCRYFHLFEQHLVREKIFELNSLYELNNIILKFIYYFKKAIKDNRVDCVLFSDVPHGAYDVILYHVAKMMGVKTLFCMSTFWNDLCYIYESLEDIGSFRHVSDLEYKIAEEFKKNLPYMNKESTGAKFRKKTRILWDFSNYFAEKKADYKRNQRLYNGFSGYVCSHVERFAKRYFEKHFFKKAYKGYFIDKINKNEKFVYFPLHLQPEMTTDTLGLQYYDQLLAIEKLRKLLPEDWYIYVKENPKQGPYMRGKNFYNRIKSIKNTKLLSKAVDTYSIMKDCQFVATITGTAGWEAITGGKPTLVFGLAWYRYLPGVSIYKDGIALDAITSKIINHSDLQRCVFNLRSTAFPFVVDPYNKALASYSEEENSKSICDAIITKLN